MNGFERRLAALEAAVAPEPQSAYDAFVARHPEIRWLTTDELLELERFYLECDDDIERAPEATQAKALSIWFAARGRMLAGEPREDEKRDV